MGILLYRLKVSRKENLIESKTANQVPTIIFCFLNHKHSRGKEFIECQNDENNTKIVFCKK